LFSKTITFGSGQKNCSHCGNTIDIDEILKGVFDVDVLNWNPPKVKMVGQSVKESAKRKSPPYQLVY